jgi:putative transposase
MMAAYVELAPRIGVAAACVALRINRAGVYRERTPGHTRVPPLAARARPPLSLTQAEQEVLLGLLDSERFAEMAPAAIFATLLDEGRYHGSIRTMYRLLAAHHQLRERRRQRVHPVYTKPELLAMRPNEVWSWDITKLKGPAKWTCFHLYVILEIFSRYVVGWMLAARESAELAEQLIADTTAKQNIAPGTQRVTMDTDLSSSRLTGA